MKELILASASPRRHDILLSVKAAHTVLPTDADETLPGGILPHDAVMLNARRKAEAAREAVFAESPDRDAVIIACDTVVSAHGEILGKPRTLSEARATLASLSGTVHSVFSGIAVADRGRMTVEYEETRVTMREISDAEIARYTECFSVLDKAGSYGIQDGAGAFVTNISGDYFNIVGLPLCRLSVILARDFAIDLI